MSRTNGWASVETSVTDSIDNAFVVSKPPSDSLAPALRAALKDYTSNRVAVQRVLNLVAGKNILPTTLVESRLNVEIERELVHRVAVLASRACRAEKRVDGVEPCA